MKVHLLCLGLLFSAAGPLAGQALFHPLAEQGIQIQGEVFFNQTGPGKALVPYWGLEIQNVMTTETQWVQKGSSLYEFDVEMGLLGRIRVNNPVQGRTVWTYHYDQNSALQKITDSSGSVVAQWFRDAKGIITRKIIHQALYTEIEPHQLDFTYFPDGSLQTITRSVAGKPQKVITSFIYPPGRPFLPSGSQTKVLGPGRSEIQTTGIYSYDNKNRLILKRETDSQGLVTTWTYGYGKSDSTQPLWRKTSWKDKTAQAPLPEETIQFTYDTEGNLIQAGNVKVQWTF